MSEQVVRIRGIDSLLFRDGRPFGAEIGALSARTLRCPYPATVTGFVRTFIGNQLGLDWSQKAHILRVLQTMVQGPLLECNREPVWHAPADAIVYEGASEETRVMPLRPWHDLPASAGCDLPKHLLPLRVTDEVKPAAGYRFWSGRSLLDWLADASGDNCPAPPKLHEMEVEERTHVAIDDVKGTSAESLLFSAQFLCFERYHWGEHRDRQEWSLLARVVTDEQVQLCSVGLLGGEKRLASIEPAEPSCWPSCPPPLRRSLEKSERVRMFLATPAVFQNGWKPGWLNGKGEGTPPSAPSLTLRLISAAVHRREAVSGWSYRQDRQQPKPVRLLAPAGSVYFFEVTSGDPGVLAQQAWLQPVSDDEHDRRDGYGLALWGIW
jgi:CRISPR-associated protein Cmr3